MPDLRLQMSDHEDSAPRVEDYSGVLRYTDVRARFVRERAADQACQREADEAMANAAAQGLASRRDVERRARTMFVPSCRQCHGVGVVGVNTHYRLDNQMARVTCAPCPSCAK